MLLLHDHAEFLGSCDSQGIPLQSVRFRINNFMVGWRTGKKPCPCTSRYVFMIMLQIWETAKKAGVITANLMWYVPLFSHSLRVVTLHRPGPPKTSRGAKPTYFVPWKVATSLAGVTSKLTHVRIKFQWLTNSTRLCSGLIYPWKGDLN